MKRSKAQREAGICVAGLHEWVDGQRRCIPCVQIKASNRKEKSPGYWRASYIKTTYGIDVQDIPDECEVCGEANGKGKGIVVDHDHKTGKVRGFLCNNCNLVLGNSKDNPARLEKLALYLRERS